MRIRGFTFTYAASQQITIARMKELVFAKFARGEHDGREHIAFPQIARDKHARVYTKHTRKNYKPVFCKRIVNRQDPKLTTRPYGYVDI